MHWFVYQSFKKNNIISKEVNISQHIKVPSQIYLETVDWRPATKMLLYKSKKTIVIYNLYPP